MFKDQISKVQEVKYQRVVSEKSKVRDKRSKRVKFRRSTGQSSRCQKRKSPRRLKGQKVKF